MSDADLVALKERLKALKQKRESAKPSQEESQQTELKTENVDEDSQNLNLTATIENNQTSQTPSQPADSVSAVAQGSVDPAKNREPTFSVFVGNLSPKIRKEQLDEHFSCCGSIKRSTIIQDHYTHLPKGYAYIEFEQKEGLENALKLNESLLLGNTIEVKVKKDKPRRPLRRSSRRRFRRM